MPDSPNITNGRTRIWNGLRTPLEYLERAATLNPQKTAVIDEAGTCTYTELRDLSRRVGSALATRRAAHLGIEQKCTIPATKQAHSSFPVIVFMEKSIDMLAAFLGTLTAGGFYVPVDPSVPPERAGRIAHTLFGNEEHCEECNAKQTPEESHSHAALVITISDLIDTAHTIFPHAEILDIKDLEQAAVAEDLLETCLRTLVDTDPAYVLFTSGSTGTPKGVAVSHRAIRGFIDGFVTTFGIEESDILGNQAPFDFDVSVKDIYGCLATGATLALLPRHLFSTPALLVEALQQRQVTVMIWAAAALCLVSSLHGLDVADLSSVRLVMFSGEVMPQKHLKRWLAKVPNATFVNLYGPTEVTCNCLFYVVDRSRTYDQGLPLGTALPGRRVLVLDDNKHPVHAPGTGEIYVGGPDIALGYYGDAKRTAAAFISDPTSAQLPATVYRTGDLVRITEDGELFFCGRADNQIKYQGHRIELEEIDAAFEAEEGVERCRCAYDARLQRIYACYEGPADPAALRSAVARRLPLPMIPSRITRVDAMPLTKNGKVDRKALIALAKTSSVA